MALTTTVTQSADQAASKSISLTFPKTLAPSVSGAVGMLCKDPDATYSNCKAVGTATAVSPALDAPLTGKLYLAGASAFKPSLAIVFPAPFSITLVGAVELAGNTVVFSTVPDMPLTSLTVSLVGGKSGIYQTACDPASGTVTASFSGQNGASATGSAAFKTANCPASKSSPASGGSHPSGGTGHVAPVGSARFHNPAGRHPSLMVRATTESHDRQITGLTIATPRGVRYATRHLRGNVKVKGARVRSMRIVHGRLVIRFKHPGSRLTVTIRGRALTIGPKVKSRIRHHRVHHLPVRITVRTVKRGSKTITRRAAV